MIRDKVLEQLHQASQEAICTLFRVLHSDPTDQSQERFENGLRALQAAYAMAVDSIGKIFPE